MMIIITTSILYFNADAPEQVTSRNLFAGGTSKIDLPRDSKMTVLKWKATGYGAETVVSEDASVLTGTDLHIDQRARGKMNELARIAFEIHLKRK